MSCKADCCRHPALRDFIPNGSARDSYCWYLRANRLGMPTDITLEVVPGSTAVNRYPAAAARRCLDGRNGH